MKVIINFDIDEVTLRYIIMDLLSTKETITLSAIKNRVKERVYELGISLIRFPEYWGIKESDFDESTIDIYFNYYKKYFNL